MAGRSRLRRCIATTVAVVALFASSSGPLHAAEPASSAPDASLEIAANGQLIADLFARLANAYAAFDSSREAHAAFRLRLWEARGNRPLLAEYERLFDAASGAAVDYAAALDALGNALQSPWWSGHELPAILRASIDGRTLTSTRSALPDGGTGFALAADGAGADAVRALFPAGAPTARLIAPVAVQPAPLGLLLPPPSPGPMPVFFYGRLMITDAGSFVVRTARELDAPEGGALFGTVQGTVCAISPSLCRKAEDPENAARVALHDGATAGGDYAAFISSPTGYAACRAAIDWSSVGMPSAASFAARLERSPARDGVALRAANPDAADAANWITADVLLSFVPRDRLAASNCWPDGTSA